MAVDNDFIRKNPCHVKLGDIIQDNTQERLPISRPCFDSVLDFIKGHRFYRKYADMMIILASTGLRISELCALTISDIDLDNRLINVTKQILSLGHEGKRFGPPKTSKGVRSIPLEGDELLNALKRVIQKAETRKKQCTIDGSSPMLFCTTRYTPQDAFNIDKQFQRIMEAYQKAYPDTSFHITPHILRHTFCSRLINNDANVKSVQYLMGHSSSNVTLDVYSHVDRDNVRETIKRLNPTNPDTKSETTYGKL